MKKLLSSCLAALICLAVLACPAFAALDAGSGNGYYAVDDAGVLSAETEALLAEYNDVLESQCRSAQFVVATVSYLDEDADVYATRLINDWGVGSSSENNGMLLLLVTEEYRGGLTVGDGLDDAFYDSFPERYYDDFWDDVDADRFDEAVQDLAGHIYDWYLDYYNVQLASEQAGGYGSGYGYGYEQPQPVSRGPSILGIIGMLLIALVLIWILGAASRFTRMSRYGYTGGFFPIFWFGGRRRYRSWMRQQPPPPPPPPGGFGPGPGGYRSPAPTRRSTFISRPPRSGGGFGSSSGASRPSGGFRSSGGPRGGGFGGHGGGGFRGRR